MKTHATVRITEYLNDSPVVITLQAGNPLSWYKARRHEEGWSSESITWEYLPRHKTIIRNYETDGRDCDGRHASIQVDECKVMHFKYGSYPEVRWVAEQEAFYPRWNPISAPEIYDEFAQRANY